MEEEEEEEKEEKKEEEVRRKAGMGKDSVETDVDRPDPNMPEADTGGTANEAADARSEELRTVVDHLAETLYGDDEDAIVRGIDLFTSSVGVVEPKVLDSEVFRYSVLNLQQALKGRGHYIAEDGILGPMTKTALRQVGESIKPPATEPGPEGPEPTSVRPVAVSDRAVTDIEDDRLGFTPYVLAIVRFLRARETESPLAITVNARWGRGKTSFMSMIETQLSRISGHEGLRFATAWFNPWKYSDREQVWASYLATVVRCIRGDLTWSRRLGFESSRIWANLWGNMSWGLGIRVLIAVALLILIVGLMLGDDSTTNLGDALPENSLLKYAYERLSVGALGAVAQGIALLFVCLYLYTSVADRLNLGLLKYLQQTERQDKARTLVQFESEMRRLNSAMPEDLKVVIFIDDLDRCRSEILWEMIEALQLLEVSRRCIFIIGMDVNIVARTIEESRPDLSYAVMTDAESPLEHGGGYKFLEKIIQVRVGLPAYGKAELSGLVSHAFSAGPEADVMTAVADRPIAAVDVPTKNGPGDDSQGLVQKASAAVGRLYEAGRTLLGGGRETVLVDSDEIKQAAQDYGAACFGNPRRLKRFINSYRLYAYLAPNLPPARIARFLVLAEKWPALLNYLLREPSLLPGLQGQDDKYWSIVEKLAQDLTAGQGRISEDNRSEIRNLLTGNDGTDPFTADELRVLSAWYDFRYYAPPAKKP